MAEKFLRYLQSEGFEDKYYILPLVTAEQDGLVLKVVDGEWGTGEMVKAVVIIEFVVANTRGATLGTYQAEEGMTWNEWCASEYDTDDAFYVNSSTGLVDCVIDGASMTIVNQYGTDIIENGATYKAGVAVS